MEFSSFRDSQNDQWERRESVERRVQSINLAPLKGAIDADPILFNDHGHAVTSHTPSLCPLNSLVGTQISFFLFSLFYF